MKRAFDFVAALIGLLVPSPLLLGMAVWVKRDSPGPLFYRPLRGGRRGKSFRIFKFRSMVVDADQLLAASPAAAKRRVTPIGALLRRTSLDELPQYVAMPEKNKKL